MRGSWNRFDVAPIIKIFRLEIKNDKLLLKHEKRIRIFKKKTL